MIVITVAGFPSARQFGEDFSTPWGFLTQHSDELVAPSLGLILIIMYWVQSNVQLGSLERTDTLHAPLVIVQLILVCSQNRIASSETHPAKRGLADSGGRVDPPSSRMVVARASVRFDEDLGPAVTWDAPVCGLSG